MFTCKVCHKAFDTSKSFNGHLRGHKTTVKEYHETHYPKFCLQTGKKLVWKDGDKIEEYLSRNFLDKTSLSQYFDSKENSDYKKELLTNYIEEAYKRHDIFPSQCELASLQCHPHLLHFLNFFDLKELIGNRKSRFDYSLDYLKPLPLRPVDVDKFTVCIDTREQKSYRISPSIIGKLDVGDYTCGREYNDGVFIERKSIGDFGGTVVGGNERFRKELDRVRESNKYLITLVEFNLHDLYNHKFFGYSNPALVAHNLRNLYRDYNDCSQIVFGVNRECCVRYVIEFLLCGREVDRIDLQLYVDMQKNRFKSFEFTKDDLIEMYKC